jgi:sarcosine oxidase, subunit gamma
MHNRVSALNGATYSGFSQIREIGPLGMITLRAKSDCAGLDAAIFAATGCARPDTRQIVQQDDRAAGWMSPDEYLLVMAYDDTATALAAIDQAMAGQHYLASDVSDARAVFDIIGAGEQVLAKLSPVDFDKLGATELRRTRTAQVAAAFWQTGAGNYRLVCFRSVADYVMGLLSHSAMSGSALK